MPSHDENDAQDRARAEAERLRQAYQPVIDRMQNIETATGLDSDDQATIFSQMKQLLLLLLRWSLQPTFQRVGTHHEVPSEEAIQRIRATLRAFLARAPRLADFLDEDFLVTAYKAESSLVRMEMEYRVIFPQACPWSIVQLLNDDFWPDAPYPER
jgi:Domain of unknown function DUF29